MKETSVYVDTEWTVTLADLAEEILTRCVPMMHALRLRHGIKAEDVRAVRPDSAAALLDYFDAVDARTQDALSALTPSDLDRIVDPDWDPPVTLGVRLISVADDAIQHIGQAAYVRGLLGRTVADQ